VEILEKVAPAPTYALDELASEQGHEILRTPPYHPELQPIETCWAVGKNQIARKSKFTMAHLLEQLDEAFDSVTEETCSGLIKKVREVEDPYWREDARLDRGQSVVSIHMTGTIGAVLMSLQSEWYLFQIEGHTDSVGSESFNQRLSERRADSVKQYLVQRFSIDPQRLIPRGYGESEPIESNDTPRGRAQNRRIEIVNLGKR
jgi:hypothetical protein